MAQCALHLAALAVHLIIDDAIAGAWVEALLATFEGSDAYAEIEIIARWNDAQTNLRLSVHLLQLRTALDEVAVYLHLLADVGEDATQERFCLGRNRS